MNQIKLTQNKYTIVDENLFDFLNQWKWYAVKKDDRFYALRNIIDKDGKQRGLYLHRFILETPKGSYTDHKDGDTLNNQKNNLRICTNAENSRNRKVPKTNKSGYKGVSWSKVLKKWRADIKINDKKICLGFLDNKEKAALIYNNAAQKYFGEFARLNIGR